MKTITLHQPWASLIALGVKTIETRPWPTKYRGPIAIHAAQTRRWMLDRPGNPRLIGEYIVDSDHAMSRRKNLDDPALGYPRWHPMTFGAVVAMANLVDCLPTDSITWGGATSPKGWSHPCGSQYPRCHGHVGESQRPYGDFAPGRWAWLLADIQPLDEPIPARGHQRLWNWDPTNGET